MSQWDIIYQDAEAYRHDALRWAWALGAPYNAYHKVPTDLPLTPKMAERSYPKILAVAREAIESREMLLVHLIRIGQAGARHDLRRLVRRFCTLPEEGWSQSEAAERTSTEQGDAGARQRLARMYTVDRDIRLCRTASFLAFDAAGAVDFVRSGLVLGLLGETEAHKYVFDLAREVAATYSSWVDYARDFKIGRDLWHGAVDDPIWIPILEDLLNSPKSPWMRLPFAFPETEETAVVTSTSTRDGPFWTLENAPPAASASLAPPATVAA